MRSPLISVPEVPAVLEPCTTTRTGSGSTSYRGTTEPLQAARLLDDRLAAADERGDSEAVARLRREQEAARGIEAAEDVTRAVETLERAVAQVSRAALRPFAERVGRVYARALHRLDARDRDAVRASFRKARHAR